jgi:hypothetical protein
LKKIGFDSKDSLISEQKQTKAAIENVGVACKTEGFLRHMLYCLSDVA